YPVLAPVSRSYPRAKGRLPTCYSPVRHSPPPEEGDPFDLHVLSTPPAFVLSQDQTLQKRSFDNPAETVPTGVGTTAIQNINGTTDKNVDTLLSSQETDTPAEAISDFSRVAFRIRRRSSSLSDSITSISLLLPARRDWRR